MLLRTALRAAAFLCAVALSAMWFYDGSDLSDASAGIGWAIAAWYFFTELMDPRL